MLGSHDSTNSTRPPTWPCCGLHHTGRLHCPGYWRRGQAGFLLSCGRIAQHGSACCGAHPGAGLEWHGRLTLQPSPGAGRTGTVRQCPQGQQAQQQQQARADTAHLAAAITAVRGSVCSTAASSTAVVARARGELCVIAYYSLFRGMRCRVFHRVRPAVVAVHAMPRRARSSSGLLSRYGSAS
jgi:hypothetical protein